MEAEAETEYETDYDDTSFSWLDFDPKGKSIFSSQNTENLFIYFQLHRVLRMGDQPQEKCVIFRLNTKEKLIMNVLPLRGKTINCRFSLTINVNQFSRNMLELKETGIHGWCSSHRDVNGLHIRGPYAEPWV